MRHTDLEALNNLYLALSVSGGASFVRLLLLLLPHIMPRQQRSCALLSCPATRAGA